LTFITFSLLLKVYAALNPHHLATKLAHGSIFDTDLMPLLQEGWYILE